MQSNKMNLQEFIEKTSRFGYFGHLKQQFGKETSSSPNKFDTLQRKKAKSHYANKIVKPFRLIDQPEYKLEQNFNKNFENYMNSLSQFQSLQNQKPGIIQKPDKKIEREVYENCLVHKIQSDVDLQKIKSRKNRFNVQSKTIYRNAPSFFATKQKTEENQVREFSASPIHITVESPRKRHISSYRQPHHKFQLNSPKYNANLTQGSDEIASPIDQKVALSNLNALQQTEYKMRNFRIQKAKLSEKLSQRYGQDILLNFYALQANEDFKGIISFVNQIKRSSDKLAQLLTFLTFDYDQDGLISQTDLTHLNNTLSPDNPVTQDMNIILTYIKKSPKRKCEPDLPKKFIVNPTHIEYLKMNKLLKSQQEEKIRGVLRHYSFKMDENEEEDDLTRKPKKNSNRKIENLTSEKYFQINFEHFQVAFEASRQQRPKFISNVIEFLIGKQPIKPKAKISKDSIQKSSYKSSLVSPKKSHKSPLLPKSLKRNHVSESTVEKIPLPGSSERKQRMKSIMSNLKQHKNYLSTIQFD